MLKIKLGGKKGVDYNAYVEDYFSDFAMDGFPIFAGGSEFKGPQLILLDKLEANPKNTKVMVLEGKDFFYYFTGHTVSGEMKSVSLSMLGKSYNKQDGSFDTDKKGKIVNLTTPVEISGLDISNPENVRGDLHDTIYALMGGAHESGGTSDPSLLLAFVNAEGHKVKGTKKGDAYKGTDFSDKVNLSKGNDVLNGAGGKDTLTGGKGKDTFVFDTALGPDNVDRIKDFVAKDDTIELDATVFVGLSSGGLDKETFTIGAGASDADHRIIYDAKSGALLFDADGNGGASAVQFATLGKNLDISAGDFLVA